MTALWTFCGAERMWGKLMKTAVCLNSAKTFGGESGPVVAAFLPSGNVGIVGGMRLRFGVPEEVGAPDRWEGGRRRPKNFGRTSPVCSYARRKQVAPPPMVSAEDRSSVHCPVLALPGRGQRSSGLGARRAEPTRWVERAKGLHACEPEEGFCFFF